MIFFIPLSCLVTKLCHINKNCKDGRFLFISRRFVTKWLSRIKKSQIFIISDHCPTRCQVPLVLKSTFKFRILKPNKPILQSTFFFKQNSLVLHFFPFSAVHCEFSVMTGYFSNERMNILEAMQQAASCQDSNHSHSINKSDHMG